MPVSTIGSALRIGPNGWAMLPPKRGEHPLTELSRYVDFVEVPAALRRALRPEVAKTWVRKVEANPNFRFAVLLGRQFSADRDLTPSTVALWSEGIRPLLDAGRLGCVVMSFPWAFRFGTENREFLIQLRRQFHHFPLVADFRHESWLREEALGTLIDYRIGFANLDQPDYMRAMPASAILTNEVGYFRFLGRRNAEAIRDFDLNASLVPSLYTRNELAEWTPRVERIATHVKTTFLAMANPGMDEPLINALQMRGVLEPGQHLAPPDLLRTHWRELVEFRAPKPVQTELLPIAPTTARPKHLAA